MGTSASGAVKARTLNIIAALAAFMLCLGLAPATSLAVEAPMLASALLDGSTVIVSEDVELVAVDAEDDAAIEPVIGSFTVDGLTFALSDDGVTLVSVAPDAMRASGPDGGRGEVGTSEPSAPSGPLAIPSNVSYDGVAYDVTTIGPYAFYLSGATQVTLPASVTLVDDRAFRSSDVERVEVAADNPNIASFDGALYDASLTSLLLIPEGRTGVVLLPSETEVAEPSLFSHCSLVEAIDVEEGDAAFASLEGLLYDASGTTLLRVPAGATDITIREGCTSIAAGAMEGCAKLERINAPASVTSISPNVFESVPTISLPASVILNGGEGSPPQLNAMVALSALADEAPQPDSNKIEVGIPKGSEMHAWQSVGFSTSLLDEEELTVLQAGSTYAAATVTLYGNGGYVQVARSGVTIANQVTSYSVAVEDGKNWTAYAGGIVQIAASNGLISMTAYRTGYDLIGISTTASGAVMSGTQSGGSSNSASFYAKWQLHTYSIKYVLGGGSFSDEPTSYNITSANFAIPVPQKSGYTFRGWQVSGAQGAGVSTAGSLATVQKGTYGDLTFTAQWERVDFNVSFDVDSEPGDEAYPGDAKGDETLNVDDGQAQIEDPQRPGYVFQGWVIPNGEGTEVIDQDLVYQGDDGEWYVDAAKLPDYANSDGKVELTARWTSVISVDVPTSVTFYADTVTQGQESREGAASSAFGQSKVSNQSEIALHVVGLESRAVETTDTMLGADSVLKKASAATPATSAQKLLSLYPSAKVWMAEELQDPSAVGTEKAATAVDFDLDDILLEAAFDADEFYIPAGGTLNMGYRLNLEETGQELDYDTLSTLKDGQSAAIANISYCFSADRPSVFWTFDDRGRLRNLESIKADAEAIAAGDLELTAKYARWLEEDHRFYVRWFDKGIAESATNIEDDSTVYEVRIIGINHDDRSDGAGNAGLTFQFVDCLNSTYRMGTRTDGGWERSELRASMNPNGLTSSVSINGSDSDALWGQVPARLQDALVAVEKESGTDQMIAFPVKSTSNKMFLLCMKEYYPRLLPASTDGFFLIANDKSSYECTTGGFGSEGTTYDYYRELNCPYSNFAGATDTPGPPSALGKRRNGALAPMWTRSLSVSDNGANNRYNYIKGNGGIWDSLATNYCAISPAFCL